MRERSSSNECTACTEWNDLDMEAASDWATRESPWRRTTFRACITPFGSHRSERRKGCARSCRDDMRRQLIRSTGRESAFCGRLLGAGLKSFSLEFSVLLEQ